jgi:hypothetical protein
MPTNVNDIRELVTRTSDGLRLAHAKELGDQLEYSDDCLVASRFAFVGVSAIWLNDASLPTLVNVAGKLLKVVRLTHTQDAARKAA